MKKNILVFDFDGIVLESVRSKLQAFKKWVPNEHLAYREAFCEYNRNAFGKSRNVQIRHFYEGILGEQISESALNAAIQRFSDINAQTIHQADWVPGIQQFLAEAATLQHRMFVLSGTPQKELESIIEKRNLTNYFEEIIGSPTNKVDGLKLIIKWTKASPKDITFFGDATADFRAARTVGTKFVYRKSEAAFLGELPDRVINNFTDLTVYEV
ncbi:MAG: HAD hydrolase-like protein [Bacteroidota bacterium]